MRLGLPNFMRNALAGYGGSIAAKLYFFATLSIVAVVALAASSIYFARVTEVAAVRRVAVHAVRLRCDRRDQSRALPGGLACGDIRRIVERRRAAVGVDVLDIGRRDVAVGERALHRPRSLRSVRSRGGHVMRVIRVSISHELGVDMGTTGTRAFEFLEHEDGATLTHHEAISVAVEGS